MAKDDGETAADGTQKLPYPKSVIFIIGSEFCERFNYYGMRAILSLYLSRILGFTDNDSTIIFHVFVTLIYALCVVGAIVSDNWLGRYLTILYLSLVYSFGSVVVAVAAIPTLSLPARELCLIGLFLIALGSGGIKPCVAAFGGDQFKMPEQAHQMTIFFSMFYFSINAGSLISTYLTPKFRADVYCFGDLHCYPLAFGVPAVLMLIAVAFFILGRPWYTLAPHSGNMMVVMFKAIGHAIANKKKSNERREHWLDFADDKFEKKFLDEVKAVMSLMVLYIPLPIFWALFDQQGSRWIFQAARMNGEIGSWNVKPEQMHIFNPSLILLFIPLFNYVFYPALSLIGIRRPLQKLVMGGTLAGVAFIISAILEFQLEKTYPILPEAQNAQLRIFNGEACDYDITTNIQGQEKFTLKSFDAYTYRDIDVPNGKFDLIYSISSTDTSCPTFTTSPISIPEKTAYTIFLNSKNTADPIIAFEDNVDKPKKGLPYGRVLANIKDSSKIHWKDVDEGTADYEATAHEHKLTEFTMGTHKIFVDNKEVLEIKLHIGGSYTIIVSEKADGTYVAQEHHITEGNSIHMFWQIPQYIAVTMGEVMYSITGLQFSYSQAPLTMKSVVQAFWLLTAAFGNIIVIFVAGSRLLKQSYEFLLFGFLMFADMAFFAFMAYRYKPHDPHETKS